MSRRASLGIGCGLWALGVMFGGLLPAAFAQGVFTDPEGETGDQSLSLPYAFINESFGTAVGYVHGVVGKPQKQSMLLTTVMAGTKGSAMLFFIGKDLLLPGTKRLFLDPVFSVGYFDEIDLYIDGNPYFPEQRAGSSGSDQDNYVTGSGWDNFLRMKFKYLLPIGCGDDEIITTYVMSNGFPHAESVPPITWNPLNSGKSYLELQPFYRSQDVEGDNVDAEIKTNGVNASLFWDNRDFFATPSHGFSGRARISRDFGKFDSSGSWTNVDGEFDMYIPLRPSKGFHQRVIAFDAWTAYSPSWEENEDGTIENRPPAYTGATLGGLWRMRGYPAQRFSDKAALYYCLELRLTPRWNPFDRWTWLQRHVGVQWIQISPFLELGRVADSWQIDRLHQDMEWSTGLGLRVWAKGIVARVDAAASDEGYRLQMMIGHPFQF